jgi:hypothetical protein
MRTDIGLFTLLLNISRTDCVLSVVRTDWIFYTLKQYGNTASFTSPMTFRFHALFWYTSYLSLSLSLLHVLRLPNYFFKLCPSVRKSKFRGSCSQLITDLTILMWISNLFTTLRLLNLDNLYIRHCRTMPFFSLSFSFFKRLSCRVFNLLVLCCTKSGLRVKRKYSYFVQCMYLEM